MNRQDGETSDGVLADRACAGDPRAFTLLMRRHKQALYRFALRYLNDEDHAYDMVQQAFVSAWKALERYDRDQPMEAWLRAIVRNKCRDHARKARLRRLITLSPVSAAGITHDARADIPDPERVASDRAELARVRAAIAALPDGLKAPLILTALEGLSMAEAARQLGLSQKAVETRLYRARKALREV